MGEADVRKLIQERLFPAYGQQRQFLDAIDRWHRFDHDKPYAPVAPTKEYKELADRAQTPWGQLVVTTVAQRLYVEGYRSSSDQADADAWRWWQANGMDARQAGVHRAALTYGLSYAVVMPGQDQLTGEPGPVIRGVSPRKMVAFYDDPAMDEWPSIAMRLANGRHDGEDGSFVWVYDDAEVWQYFSPGRFGAVGDPKFLGTDTHDAGVCPVVRYDNLVDLEGRSTGEIEPLIPTLGRIDQTAFDRLVVQRFSSWVVRVIAGLDQGENPDSEKLRLSMESILVFEDQETRASSLPATPLGGFIEAHDADLRDLSAVSQTPPHYLLGQMANLSAEALAAAESSLTSKVDERQHSFGESHEKVLRLAAAIGGDATGAANTDAQVIWKDTHSRSLAQAADALVKLAQIGIPVEFLLQMVPMFSKQDIEAMRDTIVADREAQSLTGLMSQIAANDSTQTQAAPVAVG